MSTGAPLEFLPPRFDGRVVAVCRWILPFWMRWQSRIESVEVEGIERLMEAMRSFQAGESRLLLAFRHSSLDDPLCLAWMMWVELERAARRQGIRFDPAPTGQFLFDRGIPLWAGDGIGWLFTRLGGSSLQRGKLDLPALRTARRLLLEGPHPFAVAPEGATNGHNERLSPMEPGTAQLAFWTAADLAAAGRLERMDLLPIGLQYFYIDRIWGPIEALLSQLEEGAGLTPDPGHDLTPTRLHQRLMGLGQRMLHQMEVFYGCKDELASGDPDDPAMDPAQAADDSVRFAGRLQRLLDLALRRLEQPFQLASSGSLSDRCRRLEQAGWDRLYPERAPASAPLSPLEQGLADRLADEVSAQFWHMRVVESFLEVSGSYVKEHPSQERFADTLLLLWDTQCRIQGKSTNQRPRLGRLRARISIDRPIAVEQRLADYRRDRRRAVAALTEELGDRLQALVVPSPLG